MGSRDWWFLAMLTCLAVTLVAISYELYRVGTVASVLQTFTAYMLLRTHKPKVPP